MEADDGSIENQAADIRWKLRSDEKERQEMKRLIEIDDLDIPDGYEPIAFRRPKFDEMFLRYDGSVSRITTPGYTLGIAKMIVTDAMTDVSRVHIGSIVLVSNDTDGPKVQRVLVDVNDDRDYPFVCESIDPRLPHQCWRFAKRVEQQVTQNT